MFGAVQCVSMENRCHPLSTRKAAAAVPLVLASLLFVALSSSLNAQTNNATASPTNAPLIHAADLRSYANNTNIQRATIRGVVLSEFSPGCWFAYDGALAARIRLKNPTTLHRGDEVTAT